MNTFIAFYPVIVAIAGSFVLLYEGFHIRKSKGIVTPSIVSSCFSWLAIVYLCLQWQHMQMYVPGKSPGWLTVILLVLFGMQLWLEINQLRFIFIFNMPKKEVVSHLEQYLRSRDAEYTIDIGGDVVSGDRYRIYSLTDRVVIKVIDKDRLLGRGFCQVSFNKQLTDGRAMKQDVISHFRNEQTDYEPHALWPRIAGSLAFLIAGLWLWLSS